MRYLKLTTLFAMAIAFALSLGAAPQPAEAGKACKKLGLSSPCIKKSDIKNNQVRGKHVKNGSLTTADLADGSVTGADIADRAIGAAKLGLANTIYIEDSGTPMDNCTDLLDALAGLTGPAAVVLGPGTYDCGLDPVVLPPQVSLIGSGRNLSTITGSVNGLVRLQGDDITLRDLTVIDDDSAGAGFHFVAVGIGAGSVATRNWRISNVTAEAMNGSALAVGIYARNVNCDGGEITDVTATGGGSGEVNQGVIIGCTAGSITASNLTATASDAILQALGLVKFGSSSLTVRNSSFAGPTGSVARSEGTLKVISSELDGPVFGAVICVGDYDETGAALADGFFNDSFGGCE
jgi:hypothetical protein